MRYKVYAGRVAVDFKNSLGTQTARFHWTEKVLVYDSYGDSIEGEETDGILAEPEVELENKAAGTFSCLVPYQVETRFGTIKIRITAIFSWARPGSWWKRTKSVSSLAG